MSSQSICTDRRRTAFAVATAVIVAIATLHAPSAIAIDFEKMVMPGPLASAHAEYEGDCSNCHVALDRSAQRGLCLDCHEGVASDIDEGTGLHGRHPLASVGDCRSCHAEHVGRDANIRGLSVATFGHDDVDFALEGAHESAACQDCHEPGTPRREAPSDCFSCHEQDDAHDGKLGTDCADCHESTAWKPGRFDHDETEFRLTGRHEDVSCVGCHVGNRFEDTPSDCVSCHAIDDAHGGRFGRDCASCHDTSGFKQEQFDHERESGFPLIGAHAKAECATCHTQAPGERKLPEDCSGCHASDDVHSGRFDTRCGDCHSPKGWARARFDHDRDTGFVLRGAHRSQSCESCHSGPTRDLQADTACVVCHSGDDVHQGELGTDCADCHNEESFVGRVSFDHDLTEFPLLGIHAVTPCESCHANHTFQTESLLCVSCHRSDDVHERTLGAGCQKCHTPNAWDVWRFDHDRQTEFALHGAHENLECGACHTQAVTPGFQMAQDCFQCHASDDAHRGGFGRNCGSCHGFEAWIPASVRRR